MQRTDPQKKIPLNIYVKSRQFFPRKNILLEQDAGVIKEIDSKNTNPDGFENHSGFANIRVSTRTAT
jgi:hypothetical protein